MMTVGDLIESHLRLRLWCFRCARGVVVDPNEKMAAVPLAEVRAKCKSCRQRDQVLALPAKGLPFRPSAPGEAMTDLVAAFFFGMRKKRKRY